MKILNKLTELIDFKGKKILVKFYFTNRKLIPSGIHLKPRHENEIELKHLKSGGLKSMETFRKGRVDTAKKHEKLENVNISNCWNELERKKFKITNIHLFFQQRSNGMKKPVVVVTFENNPKNSYRAKKSVLKQIENNFVHHGSWGIIHYWENPNRINTVNCLKRQPTF